MAGATGRCAWYDMAARANSCVVWTLRPGLGGTRGKRGLHLADEAVEGPQRAAPVYPERLRQAGLSGRVLVSAVIDTTGHSEPGSINIIDSPHEDFSREARRYVAGAEFQPALIGDRPTRVCTQIPVDFKITGWP